MLKHIAVRLRRSSDAQIAFEIRNSNIVNAALEKRDPALRNLTEGLYNNGVQSEVDGCKLFWFQILDDNSPDFYQYFDEVECVFSSAWFDEEKSRIRHFAGVKYYDASSELAKQFELKDQNRKIDYSEFLRSHQETVAA